LDSSVFINLKKKVKKKKIKKCRTTDDVILYFKIFFFFFFFKLFFKKIKNKQTTDYCFSNLNKMSIFVILAQLLFGPEQGSCEVCGQPGKKQQSLVDPCSPSLKILCSAHWKQFVCGNACSFCGKIPTYNAGLNVFWCQQCIEKGKN
jgi:hypothetical protein